MSKTIQQPAWSWLSLPILAGPMKGLSWHPASVQDATCVCLGRFEREQTAAIARHLGPGDVFFDVGAGDGYFTLLAARKIGAIGQVVALEADPRSARMLSKRIAANSLVNVALLPYGDSGEPTPSNRFQLDLPSVDVVVRQQRMRPTHIRIAGADSALKTLKGARTTLVTARPTLFLSLNAQTEQLRCCRWLKDLGFELVPLDAGEIEACSRVLCLPPALTHRKEGYRTERRAA